MSLDLLQFIETQSRVLVSIKSVVLELIHRFAYSRITMYPQHDRVLIMSDRGEVGWNG